MTLTEDELARLETLLAAATDAPWQWLDSGGENDVYDELQDGHGEMVASGFRDDINLEQRGVPGHITDGRLCAALRNAAPALIAALRDTPVADTAGIDAGHEELRMALREAVTNLPQPTLGKAGGVERGAVIDAIERVFAAALRTPRPEGELE